MLKGTSLIKSLTPDIFTFQDVLFNYYYPYAFRPMLKSDAMRLKVVVWRRTAICLQYGLKFSKSHPAALFVESGFVIHRYTKGIELLTEGSTFSVLSSTVPLFYLHFKLCSRHVIVNFAFMAGLYSVYRLYFRTHSLTQRLMRFQQLTNRIAICTHNIPQYNKI